MDTATLLIQHLRRISDHAARVQAVIDVAQSLDIGAKVKTSKAGGTTITIPASGSK